MFCLHFFFQFLSLRHFELKTVSKFMRLRCWIELFNPEPHLGLVEGRGAVEAAQAAQVEGAAAAALLHQLEGAAVRGPRAATL